MTKQEVIRDIEKKFPGQGFLSATQIGQYRGGVSRHAVSEITEGLDFIGSPKKKLYFVGDVAERIVDISHRMRTEAV